MNQIKQYGITVHYYKVWEYLLQQYSNIVTLHVYDLMYKFNLSNCLINYYHIYHQYTNINRVNVESISYLNQIHFISSKSMGSNQIGKPLLITTLEPKAAHFVYLRKKKTHVTIVYKHNFQLEFVFLKRALSPVCKSYASIC